MTEAMEMPQPLPARQQLPSSSRPSVPEQFLYKNRLQEYTQSLGIPLPTYHTVNEGVQHAPRFRSTVTVDGATYMSVFTFSHRKAAEQDVAKLALEHVSKRLVERVVIDAGCPLLCQDPVFCKSILHEFAAKMKFEKPTYTTTQIESTEPPLPGFVSSLNFYGKNYTGTEGRSKKEAEQMAARAVILSLLGNAEWKSVLSQIINSKMKMYAASQKTKKPGTCQNAIQALGESLQSSPVNHLNDGKQFETISATNNQEPVAVSAAVANEPYPVIHHNELIIHNVKLPPDAQGMHLITDNARKRRKKNKREKDTKKLRNIEQEVVKCATAQENLLEAQPASTEENLPEVPASAQRNCPEAQPASGQRNCQEAQPASAQGNPQEAQPQPA